ncbi:Conserved_hypothetical protein [Hexamita inflata]|uniref:Spt4/RpoE2 zinc finger domain-containing protein n=1 Tax=Hexamita inflata TaxID=28002 RepID=A0AA86PUP0_9EUKA|nr:Conserved hypothetical protein [Hexamita inflata]CAI9946650.1 Conserved hypothetical protein [Hexamita inflata]CAI9963997.1 Conserved hypothetical protein [Hexamita inflata]
MAFINFEEKELRTLKACMNCYYLNSYQSSSCANCRETNLIQEYNGMVGLLDPSSSYIVKLIRSYSKYGGDLIPGFYAVKIEEEERLDGDD